MPHLGPHLAVLLAVVSATGLLALRVVMRLIKLALLLATPALLYLLHSH